MRALPLEAKIVKTQLRIREWYEHWAGNVYVSFSGGKDSTVLLHIFGHWTGISRNPRIRQSHAQRDMGAPGHDFSQGH